MTRRETDPNHVWDEAEERSSETGFEDDDKMFLEIFLEDLDGGDDDDDEDALDELEWASEPGGRRRIDLPSRSLDPRMRLRDDD
jgi:hypothetical protein